MTKEQAAEIEYPTGIGISLAEAHDSRSKFITGWDACEANRWIRVEDKLPDSYVTVLIVMDNKYVQTAPYYWADAEWYRSYDGQTLNPWNNITHWQHLPQPPIK